MNRNPFLKAEQKINRAVYNNPATLHVVVRRKSYEPYSGDLRTDEFDFLRTIYLGDPQTLSDYIVSTREYEAGDLRVDVAYQEFLDAIAEMHSDDPAVEIDGVAKSLAELRGGGGNAFSGGIDMTSDWLDFAGKRWRFLKMVPRTYWAGVPSVVRLHLREIPSDAT